MEAHPSGTRLPFRPRAVAPQPGRVLPRLPAIARPKQPGGFHPGVDRVRIGERRLEMPDALELPGMLRAVVPLVRGEGFAGPRRRVVDELVALARGHTPGRRRETAARTLPRLAAVAGTLDHLAEPAARLRRVQAVRIGGRSLDGIHLPSRQMRAADVPLRAPSARRPSER